MLVPTPSQPLVLSTLSEKNELISPLAYFGSRSGSQDDILQLLCAQRQQRGKPFNCCFDLFAGSLSMSLPLIMHDIANKYVVNDFNPSIAIFWKMVQQNSTGLVQAYLELLKHYVQTDALTAKTRYVQIREEFNAQLCSALESTTVQQAARFALLINHAAHGITLFSGKGELQLLTSEAEDNPSVNVYDNNFERRVLACCQALQGKTIEFYAHDFISFKQSVTPDDLVLLDPPYPDMPDAQESEQSHIYMRSEPKRDLKRKLKELLHTLDQKQVPFIMFYGVLGMNNPYQIKLQYGHLLRVAGTPQGVFKEYVEHLYVSKDIATLFVNHNLQSQLKARIQPLIHHLIEIHAQIGPYKNGNNIALVWGNLKWRYYELNEAANRLAHHLLDNCGLRQKLAQAKESQDELVVLYCERGPQYIQSWLATMKSGAAYLPLDTNKKRLSREAAYERIARSGARYLVTHPYLLEELRAVQGKQQNIEWEQLQIITLNQEEYLDEPFLRNYATSNPGQRITPKHLAYVMYTSGSTGEPKGVEILQGSLSYAFESHQDLLKIGADDKVAQFASAGFDASLMEIMMALAAGGELHLVDERSYEDPTLLSQLLKEHEITIAIQTPKMLMHLNPHDLPHLRSLLIVGDSFEKSLSDAWLTDVEIKGKGKKLRKVVNGYGLTETTICTTLELCHKDKPLTIGQPIFGCEVYLRPLHEEIGDALENHNSLNYETQWVQMYNEPGALYVAGPCVARGYWQRNDLTQASFKIVEKNGYSKRFYRSGDVGFIHPQVNNIMLKGRIDRQVKIRGQRLELGELEQKIKNLNEIVKDVRVLAYDKYEERILSDGKRIVVKDKELVVFIVPQDNNLVITDPQKPAPASIEKLRQIRENLRQQSAQFVLPALNHMRFIEALPYKNNDKKSYDDKTIQATYPILPCIQLPSLSWETVVQDLMLDKTQEQDFQQICMLYAESLGLSLNQISYEAEYDSLGGDSLKVKWFFERLKALQSNRRLKSITAAQGLSQVTIADFAKDPSLLGLWHCIQMKQLQVEKAQKEFETQLQQMPKHSTTRLMGEALGFYKQENRFQSNQMISLPVFMIPSLLGDSKIDYAGSELERLPFELIESNSPIKLLANTTKNFFQQLTELYVSRIRPLQKSGPYFIIGWSSGGLIAVMIANSLRKMGETAFAINLDGHHPNAMHRFNTTQYAELLSLVAAKIKDGIWVILGLNNEVPFELPTVEVLSRCSNKAEQIKVMLTFIRNSLETLERTFEQDIENDSWQRARKILLSVECILMAELEPVDISMDAQDCLLVASTSEDLWGKNLGWSITTTQTHYLKNCNHFNLLYHEDLVNVVKNMICELVSKIKTPYYQGFSCALQEKWEEAIAYYNQAIAHNPKDADVFYIRGVAKGRLNSYKEALSDFDEAIKYGYTEAQIFLNRGSIKARLDLLKQALTDLDEAVRRITDNTGYAANIFKERAEIKSALELNLEALKDYDEAIKLNPGSAEFYHSRGQIKEALAFYEEALKDYNLAIIRGYKEGDAYVRRAQVRAKLGSKQEALKDYDEALKRDFAVETNKAIAYKGRGVLKANLGRFLEAIKDYEEAILLGFDSKDEIKQCLGISKYNLGLYQEAIKEYDEAIKYNPDEASVYFNRACAKDKLGLFAEAVEDYDVAINKGCKDKDVYRYREGAKSKLRSYQEALRDFAATTNRGHANAKAYYNLGLAKAKLCLNQEAIKDYDEAIRLGLNVAKIFYDRGSIKATLGLTEEAIQDYGEAIRRNLNDPEVYLDRGMANAKLSRFQDSVKDYDEAIKQGLNTAHIYHCRGVAKHNLRLPTEAIKDYDEAMSRGCKNADLYHSLGLSKMSLGLFQEALNGMDEAYKLGLRTPDLYRNRGTVKLKLSQHEKAVADFDEAISLGLKNAGIYYERGACKTLLGLHREALDDMDEAIRLDSEDGRAYYLRGVIKEHLKDFEGSLKDYNEAIRRNPDPEDFYHRGIVKTKLGLYQEALTDFDEAIKRGYDEAAVHECRSTTEANLKLYQEANFKNTTSPAIDEDEPTAYYKRGLAKANLELHQEALKDFDEAIKRGLNNAEIYYQRGRSKAILELWQEALADCEEGIKRGCSNAEIYFCRGAAKANLGFYPAAIEDYNLAVNYGFNDAKVYYGRGVTHLNLKLYDEALKDFNEAINNRGFSFAKAYYLRGVVKAELNQYQEAIEDFNEAIKRGYDSKPYYSRGMAKRNLKQYDEAIKDFDKAIEHKPNKTTIYQLRGFTKLALKKCSEAINDFDKAIALEPSNPNNYFNRGYARNQLDLYQEAIEDFDVVIAFNGEDPEAYFERGVAKFQLDLYREAIEDFDKGIDCGFDNPEILFQRGQAKAGLELYEEAIEDFNSAIENGFDEDKIYCHRGVAKYHLGQYHEAIEDLDTAIEYDDTDLCAYYFRGKAKHSVGSKKQAIKDFDIVLERETGRKKRATAYRERADVKADLRNLKRALADYDESIMLNPKSETSYYNRAFVKRDLRLYREAVKDFSMALIIEPDDHTYFNRGIAKLLDQHGLSKYYIEGILNDLEKKLQEKNLDPGDFNLTLIKKALKNLEKAVQFYPSCRGFWVIGKLKCLLGQHKSAIRDFERMEQLATANHHAFSACDELLCIYEMQGMDEQARTYRLKYINLVSRLVTAKKRKNETSSEKQSERSLKGYEQFGLLRNPVSPKESKLPRTDVQHKKTVTLLDGREIRIVEIQEASGDGNCGFRAMLGEYYLQLADNLLTRKGVIDLLKNHLNQPAILSLIANDLIAKYQEWTAGTWIMEQDKQFPQEIKEVFVRIRNESLKDTSPSHLAQVNTQLLSFCNTQKVIEHYLDTYLSDHTIWPHFQGSVAAFAHILRIKVNCLQVQPDGSITELRNEDNVVSEAYQEEVFLILNKERTHFDRLEVEIINPSGTPSSVPSSRS